MLLTAAACGTLAVAIFYWVFTAAPAEAEASPSEVRRQALTERKAAVYENLKDLHFEHLAGKLSESDYERTRTMLEAEAASVVAALESAQ